MDKCGDCKYWQWNDLEEAQEYQCYKDGCDFEGCRRERYSYLCDKFEPN